MTTAKKSSARVAKRKSGGTELRRHTCARCEFVGNLTSFDEAPKGWIEVRLPPTDPRIYCDRCSLEISKFLSKAPVRVTSEEDVFTYKGAITTLTVDVGAQAKHFAAALNEMMEASAALMTWATRRLPLETKKKIREEGAAILEGVSKADMAAVMRGGTSAIFDAAKLPDLKVVK